MHPPFDEELAEALEAIRAVSPTTITPDMVHGIRAAREAMSPTVADLEPYGRVERLAVPGLGAAPDVPVTVIRPRTDATDIPAVLYCHGGGMMWGNSLSGVATVLEWAEAVGPFVTVSVDYRLAPDHPHPAPVDDAYAGLIWTADHAAELGYDPSRLLVAGTSAGGGLAAALALRARDEGGPALLGQVLMCPMLDDRQITPSSGELHGEGIWDAVSNQTAWDALLPGTAKGADVSPYAAPARADDLSNLPPAFLDVGSVETFRDEVVEYAARLWRAGTQAELHVWPGGWHGFDSFVPTARLSQQARAARAAWLQRLLAG